MSSGYILTTIPDKKTQKPMALLYKIPIMNQIVPIRKVSIIL